MSIPVEARAGGAGPTAPHPLHAINPATPPKILPLYLQIISLLRRTMIHVWDGNEKLPEQSIKTLPF
jgi:hypothetical protein